MKLTFTEKLILTKLEEEGDRKILKFASYLKENYVENALVITIKDNVLEKIYFSSNEYGTAEWVNGSGVHEASQWESEQDIKDVSTIAGRYPSIIGDGPISVHKAFKTVIPDVLNNMLDPDFSVDIFKIVSKESFTKNYDWNKVISDFKRLTEIFIENHIRKNA